jgi:hypothetical protein
MILDVTPATGRAPADSDSGRGTDHGDPVTLAAARRGCSLSCPAPEAAAGFQVPAPRRGRRGRRRAQAGTPSPGRLAVARLSLLVKVTSVKSLRPRRTGGVDW